MRTRPIPCTRGLYLAGDDGSIWRAPRYVPGRGLVKMRRVKARAESHGRRGGATYLRVNLTVNGVERAMPVHRLVAEAWCENWHPLLQVHHVNGDPRDNRACNLECLTEAEHMVRHGADVHQVDLENCLLDFELHRHDRIPGPFDLTPRALARARRERARHARAPVGACRVARRIEGLIARSSRLAGRAS